ncbi:P-loop containing nucleoside triphosphate hydrolase protein [Xylaria grammica]|nr:P-loop containing nucleoside triphosphate hydrolase protein [Xylaria grammica]
MAPGMPITPQAEDQIKQQYVFIKPSSIEELEARLRRRGTESEKSIQKRLTRAQAELGYSKPHGIHGTIITNDEIEEAFQRLVNIFFTV